MRYLLALLLLLGLAPALPAHAARMPQPEDACGIGGVGFRSISYCGKYSGAGGGGTTCAVGGATWPQCADATTCRFFVAASGGNDANDGLTTATPFATLAKAQTTMQGALIPNRVTCLKAGSGGTYTLGTAITLTTADHDEVWQFDPASGVTTAVLDGGGTTNIFILNNGLSGIKINGLKLQHVSNAAIIQANSSTPSSVIIENNECTGTSVISGGAAASGCITVDNGTFTIKHNYVHDTRGPCISVLAFNAGETLAGSSVDSNVCIGALTAAGGDSDDGAIYTNMRGSGAAAGSMSITNNYIRDYGLSTSVADQIGVYLDDNSSNVTVSGNIIGAPAIGAIVAGNTNNSAAAFNNGGSNNTWTGNIIDLGGSSRLATLDFGVSNMTVSGNVVLSNFGSGLNTSSSGVTGFAYYNNSAASNYVIQNNDYWNYAAGGSVFSNGTNVSDASPQHVNPQITGYLYTIAPSSPLFSAPINFPTIVGGWGPVGFVIPTSPNHSNP